MRIAQLKKTTITLGIFLFFLGLLMSVSHINYGMEVFTAGIILLPTGLLIPVQKSKKETQPEITQHTISYPTINQSFGITGMVILGMIVLYPLKKILGDFIGEELNSLIGYSIVSGIVLSIGYNNRKRINKTSSFNLSIGNKKIIPIIIIASLVLNAGIAGPLASLIPMPESIIKIMLKMKEQVGFWTFIMMVIAAPLLEEFIYRGIILDGLLKRYTPLTSILISSILFGIAHFNPWQLVTASLLGTFSGWIYYKTKSLAPSIIIHAAVNLFGFITRFFVDMDSGMNQSAIEICGGIINFILVLLSSLILLVFCIYYLQREFSKEKIKISTENI